LFADDRETFQALQLLETELRTDRRPLVIWIGAGVSTWAGYPLWNDLAAGMHSFFSRVEPSYDVRRGAQLLEKGLLPDIFQMMCDCNASRYHQKLAETFQPQNSSPVHQRLIHLLSEISPLRLLTTNVDESLERNIPNSVLLQRTDFEQTTSLLNEKTSFICKLHGSISTVESAVFSTADYQSLTKDTGYLHLLRSLFANSNVVFLGYSVRDDYVVRTLIEAIGERQLFGAGEHFVVTSSNAPLPSKHLRCIQYLASPSSDHRASLQVLEIIREASKHLTKVPSVPKDSINLKKERETIYYIADLLPPGTWQTSQTLRIKGLTGNEHEMLVGSGYVDGEVKAGGYSAMHDIVVGLLCFDKIYFSLNSLGKVHTLLGPENFWRLVEAEALRMVLFRDQPALIYATPGAHAGGELGSIELGGLGSTDSEIARMKVDEYIRRSLTALPGKEQEANQLFDRLAACVTELPASNVPGKVRSALVHPSLRRILGISGGTSASAIPRWVAFPVLRLASVIETAECCQYLNAVATRLLWGSERLAGAAFSVASSQAWTDEAASYVLTGRFNSDVGALIEQDSSILLGILAFRESQAGASFRKEVAERLSTNDAGELLAAVNSGLRQSIPISTLETARDQLSGLFVPRDPLSRMTPAVWGDLRNGDQRLGQWRQRSRFLLEQTCTQLGVGPYDQCPCGSGEKLKFCCQEALRQ